MEFEETKLVSQDTVTHGSRIINPIRCKSCGFGGSFCFVLFCFVLFCFVFGMDKGISAITTKGSGACVIETAVSCLPWTPERACYVPWFKNSPSLDYSNVCAS